MRLLSTALINELMQLNFDFDIPSLSAFGVTRRLLFLFRPKWRISFRIGFTWNTQEWLRKKGKSFQLYKKILAITSIFIQIARCYQLGRWVRIHLQGGKLLNFISLNMRIFRWRSYRTLLSTVEDRAEKKRTQDVYKPIYGWKFSKKSGLASQAQVKESDFSAAHAASWMDVIRLCKARPSDGLSSNSYLKTMPTTSFRLIGKSMEKKPWTLWANYSVGGIENVRVCLLCTTIIKGWA